MNDKFSTRNPCLLLEKGHEMGLAIPHKMREVINRQILLVIVVDVVNQLTNLLVFTIGIICRFLNNIMMVKQEIKKFVDF